MECLRTGSGSTSLFGCSGDRLGAQWCVLVLPGSASGVMATGWVQVGSTWYYLSPSDDCDGAGVAEGGGYCFTCSLARRDGDEKIWGTWYHFADNGQLIS